LTATLIATFAGCLAIQPRFSISSYASCIFLPDSHRIALYSVNLRIGPAEDQPINMTTVYTPIEHLGVPSLYAPVVLLAIIVAIVKSSSISSSAPVSALLCGRRRQSRMAQANGIQVGGMIVIGLAWLVV
jgi:ABC-type uncharacterized transport system permease subunit